MAGRKLVFAQERVPKAEFQSLGGSNPINHGNVCEAAMLNADHGSQHKEEKEKFRKYAINNHNHSDVQKDIALVALLKACAKEKDLFKGSTLHARIAERELHKKNIFLGSTLVTMYARCGALVKAQEIFDELPAWDVVSWTALMTGYAHYGNGEEAFKCFEHMQREGLSPDALTFACILKACGSIGAAERGRELHAKIIKRGLHENNMVLCTAIVDMYAKCGALQKAQLVFDELLIQDVVSWTALIWGYCQHGHGEEALICFAKMMHLGLLPNAMTFACILKACGSIGAVDRGTAVHADIARRGLMENDNVLGVALVDMYAKCGAFDEAKQVFDNLARQDTALWNALVTGYCQHGLNEEALHCFEIMRHKAGLLDAVTFASLLKACGSLGAVEKGKEIHYEIVREGWLEKLSVLGSALVDMYAKCGALARAQEVFDKLSVQDVFSWTALIAGYCQHGYGEEALKSFECMMRDGHSPDAVTFTCILKTCSRIAAVEKGERYFKAMAGYGFSPTPEHHTCMVDLFGRWGHFDKAITLITDMPASNYLPTWYSLLAACRSWGNIHIGRLVFEHAVQLDEKSAVAYVCMSNMYAASGMQEEADRIEAMRMKNKAWMKPECCNLLPVDALLLQSAEVRYVNMDILIKDCVPGKGTN